METFSDSDVTTIIRKFDISRDKSEEILNTFQDLMRKYKYDENAWKALKGVFRTENFSFIRSSEK